MKKLIVGNWKMNPGTVEEARNIFSKIRRSDLGENTTVILCPPSTFIHLGLSDKSNYQIGAQNVNENEKGSFTGEISASMLKDLGVTYCIVGHSERRKMGESSEQVSKKAERLIDCDITPIICVGENERDQESAYLSKISEQIKASIPNIESKKSTHFIIAYEPIWAIGAPEPMKTNDIYETTIFIRKVLSDIFGREKAIKIPVLYGGAVNKTNAKQIVDEAKVDGFIIGRESLDASNFIDLIKSI
jgi:triosephosphate isomerase